MEEISAGRVEDIADGTSRVIVHQGRSIAIFRRGASFYAVDDVCPHMGGSIGMGWCRDGDSVVCPLHGWEFRLEDGSGVWPANARIASYPIRVEDDELFVTPGARTDASAVANDQA
jgi:nitrite reductase (NADH) small subunit/3-phenylpropionate/trans-cinnamate dioxygenase ferredoxin subunit